MKFKVIYNKTANQDIITHTIKRRGKTLGTYDCVDPKLDLNFTFDTLYEFPKGHSFISFPFQKAVIESIDHDEWRNYAKFEDLIVLDAIIPKGTSYKIALISDHSSILDNQVAYLSESIKITKQVFQYD
jgi:hypothetical protein